MTEIDGMTVCNFTTTWGDGMFEVHRDLNEAGELVQVRIELAQKTHCLLAASSIAPFSL